MGDSRHLITLISELNMNKTLIVAFAAISLMTVVATAQTEEIETPEDLLLADNTALEEVGAQSSWGKLGRAARRGRNWLAERANKFRARRTRERRGKAIWAERRNKARAQKE